MSDPVLHRISLVIPIYRGEKTLPALIEEITPLTLGQTTPGEIRYVVCEVILVHDCGPDRSDRVLEALGSQHSFVRPVWLSRNYGQHPATMAGMASATGDWVATIDEDGQQDPADIGHMLDRAISASLQLVYALPTNPPPHGWLRNVLSRTAKAITTKLLGNSYVGKFNSFRLVDGETAIERPAGTVVSLVAIGRCEGVTTTGLRWPLDNATLEFSPRGIHNEVAATVASVRAASGDLLLFEGRWVEKHG